jgi:serine/threonine protein kinase/tetratricopeptide (TPR) repeat protein
MFPPSNDEAPTAPGEHATDPSSSAARRSATRSSRAGGSPTPDSLLGIDGSEQKVLRDSIKARLFPAMTGGVEPDIEGSGTPKIARFTVLRRIGEGGMGVVFAAYDEELDRKLAIKLLRSKHRSDDRSRARLLREAQALARLSHPNVVGVHEVGEWRGEVYLAMEFVPGETLRRWLVRPRPWLEIVDVLIQAGRGLQAAHEAGLIHRDFKPDNVMVGEDRRVRVLDFGLVRASEDSSAHDERAERPEDVATVLHPLALSLTRVGSLLGTPIYMSPEQHVGAPATASGDQFSFCVTAFEALFGRRPFVGDSLIALIEAARDGQIQAVPKDSRVARRVREAVLRGLAADPAQRWPSMAALLAELDAGRGRRAGSWPLLAAAGTGAILAGVLAASWPEAEVAPTCASVDASALAGTWDPARRQQIEQAMLATGLPHAASSFAVLANALDVWTGEWVATGRRSCEATHVHAVQSSAVLERQQACLRGQVRRVDGLLEVFADVDPTVLERTGELLEHLPDPARCSDPDEQPTLDPALAERLIAIEEQVGEVEGLLAVGKREQARERLSRVELEATGLVHPPTELRIRGLGIELEWARGYSLEVAHRWRALAGEARLFGLDELETDLRVKLAIAGARNLPTIDLERWLIDDAELALAAHDEHDSRRVLQLQRARVRLLEREGRHGEAKAGYLELLAASERRGSPILIAQALQSLANVEADAGDLDAADQGYLRARAIMVEHWGPDHPDVAMIDYALALVSIDRGDFEKATLLLDRAEAIHETNPGSLALADDRNARVALAVYTGELDEAGELARAALEVYERELGPEHETTLRMLELRGIVRYFEGDFEGSLADYDRVMPAYVALFGERDVQVGLLHINRGDTLLALGRPREALAENQLAHSILSAAVPDHALLGSALAGRGEARLGLGEHELAIADLEAALVRIEPGEVTELAETRFTLARALSAVGRDPERVIELGDQARASFEQLGLTTQLETLDRWRQH